MNWDATWRTGAAIAWLAYRGLIRVLDLLAAGMALAGLVLILREMVR